MATNVYSWLKILFVCVVIFIFSVEPPQRGQAQVMLHNADRMEVKVDNVLDDTTVKSLIVSAKSARTLISENSQTIGENSHYIREQLVLIERQNKIIDSLERVGKK